MDDDSNLHLIDVDVSKLAEHGGVSETVRRDLTRLRVVRDRRVAGYVDHLIHVCRVG